MEQKNKNVALRISLITLIMLSLIAITLYYYFTEQKAKEENIQDQIKVTEIKDSSFSIFSNQCINRVRKIEIVDNTTIFKIPERKKIEYAILTWAKIYSNLTKKDGFKSIEKNLNKIIFIEGQPEYFKYDKKDYCGLAYSKEKIIVVRADEWTRCGWKTFAHELTHKMLQYDFGIFLDKEKKFQQFKKEFEKFQYLMDFAF